MVFPSFSGRFASSIAVCRAAPEEIPTRIPSFSKEFCHREKNLPQWLLSLHRKSLYLIPEVQILHRFPEFCGGPVPLKALRIRWPYSHTTLPVLSDIRSHSHGSAGSHACHENIHFSLCVIPDFVSCRGKCRPLDWQLSNCLVRECRWNFLIEFPLLGNAPVMPLVPSVSTISAPYAFRIFLLSTLMVSGMVRISL